MIEPFSIDRELRGLQPLTADTESIRCLEPHSAVEQWDELAKAVSRLGKQQWRANQNVDLALQEVATTSSALREHCDDLRRQLDAERQDAVEARLAAVTMIDHLDDLMVMARQKGDEQWISRVERLSARALEALAAMGASEIATADTTFDERVHEAVDAVDRGALEPYTIVAVIRRGFRFNGRLLRRAQVVATR